MAKIELVNVCKGFKCDHKLIVSSFKTVRNMQSGTIGNYECGKTRAGWDIQKYLSESEKHFCCLILGFGYRYSSN